MAEKKALTDVTARRYRKAGKTKKSVILDEFCASTGYNRKYAITLLRHAGKTQLRRLGKKTVKVKITAKRCGKRIYRRFYPVYPGLVPGFSGVCYRGGPAKHGDTAP
jgi:hypothetical protein